jgi:ankyrin repeat protein
VQNRLASLEACDPDGRTPLLLAAYGGRAEVLEELIEEQGADEGARDNDDDDALALAAREVRVQALWCVCGWRCWCVATC